MKRCLDEGMAHVRLRQEMCLCCKGKRGVNGWKQKNTKKSKKEYCEVNGEEQKWKEYKINETREHTTNLELVAGEKILSVMC